MARPAITLDQLHTFVTVADTGHQRRAADQLHLSGAAVSEQLRLLELRLGLRLFERLGRGTRLTQPGRALVAAARAALQATRIVEEIAIAHRGLEQGVLTVAAGHALAQHRLPTWLREFFIQHAHIEIELRMVNAARAVDALREGVVDLALIGGPVPSGRFESIEVARDQLVIAVASGHPLASWRAGSSRRHSPDLKQHRYLMRGEGSGTEVLARSLLGSSYLAGPVQRLGLGTVPLALLAGLGYAVMPWFAVEAWVRDGRVVILPHHGPAVYQVFRALRRSGPQPPASDAFWNYLTQISLGESRRQHPAGAAASGEEKAGPS